MSSLLLFLIGAIVAAAWAQSATIFPVALGPDANLQGEIIGSDGDLGTSFVVSGETHGIAFTLTLAEGATRVSEMVSIPTRSFDLSIGCIVGAGSAICENVVVSDGVTNTLDPTTLPFSPFPIPVLTTGVLRSTRTAARSSSSSLVASSRTEGPSLTSDASSFATTSAFSSITMVGTTSAHTAPPSVTLSVPISTASARPTLVPSSSSLVSPFVSTRPTQASSTAVSPTASVAALTPPSTPRASANDAGKLFTAITAVVLSLIAVLCILG